MKKFLINIVYIQKPLRHSIKTKPVEIEARTPNAAVKKFLHRFKIMLDQYTKIQIKHLGTYNGKPMKLYISKPDQ